MPAYYYRFIANIIATIHIVLYCMNIISIPMLIAYQPFYIWCPMLTFMVSPLLGGSYCMFNRLENYYRAKAGMPLIWDQSCKLFNLFKKDTD